jgi:type II secretory pathway pseudopilin PulG
LTLVEVLIVAVLIGVLAGIAVPNMRTARTRSNLAQVRADLRSLAAGVEAYFVDYQSYPCRNLEGETPLSAGSSESRPWFSGFRQLTTPIAYIISIPIDPFGGGPVGTRLVDFRGSGYGVGTGDALTRRSTGHPDNLVTARLPADCWMLESDGPDHWDDTSGSALATSRFPWSALFDPNDLDARVVYGVDSGTIGPVSGLIYDPSNGTISGGEIIRFGGTPPEGAVYEYFWTHGWN